MKLLLSIFLLTLSYAAWADNLFIAASSDIKPALEDIIDEFEIANHSVRVNAIYGASGRLASQIRNGTPFELFFAADMDYPQRLYQDGLLATEPLAFAESRLVMWSTIYGAQKLNMARLLDGEVLRIAIANPEHASMGAHTEQALRKAGVWDAISPKLLYSENATHAAHFVEMGNAQVGIVSLAMALSPQLAATGEHWLIPADLHPPLHMTVVITNRGNSNPIAQNFIDFLQSIEAQSILNRYGLQPKKITTKPLTTSETSEALAVTGDEEPELTAENSEIIDSSGVYQ